MFYYTIFMFIVHKIWIFVFLIMLYLSLKLANIIYSILVIVSWNDITYSIADTVINPSWLSIYSGTSHYFEDRGLSLFTTYLYKITVYNSVGQLTSSDSVEATTYGGFPRQAAVINVVPIDHVTLQVSWETPGMYQNLWEFSKGA